MARGTVTRREVLELAAKLFAKHGYASTSLEAVASRLGVTRQALYYHFRSKGEILGALFDEMMTRLESGIARVSEEPDDRRFLAMLKAHIATTVEQPDLVALLLHERPAIAKLKWTHASTRRRDYANLFTDAYDSGVKAGALKPLDPWLAVNGAIAAANGVSSWYHAENSRVPPGEIAESMFDLLSTGFIRPEYAHASLPSAAALEVA